MSIVELPDAQKRELGTIYTHEDPLLKRDLIISTVISFVMIAGVICFENGYSGVLNNVWLHFVLASIIQFFTGWRFYKNSWNSLRGKCTNTDALVAAGTTILYFLSVYNSFLGPRAALPEQINGIYFTSPAVIITLILLGRYLERSAYERSPDTIERLRGLVPVTARVRRLDSEIDVPTEQVVPGDIVVVGPDEIIPVDGEIISGLSTVDESMLTGGSMAAAKQPGDKVMGATINKGAAFEMRAEKVGTNTAHSQIIRALKEARSSKAPIQKIADCVLGIFVFAIFAAALLTLTGWRIANGNFSRALINAVSVLIVASFGALGLAISSAITAGIGKAAEKGILIKGGVQLENAHKITAIVFDKSSAVMDGCPEVTDVIAFSGFFEEEIISFAAAAEKNSVHPIGAAICRYAQPKIITDDFKENVVSAGGGETVSLHSEKHGFIGSSLMNTDAFEPVSGRGIRALVGGREVLAGSRGLLSERGIPTHPYEVILAGLEDDGKTATLVAINGKAAGVIAVSEAVKENLAEAVGNLKSMGIEVFMITGGSARTANAIAKQAGIEHVLAEISPLDKVEEILKLKSSEKLVAVAGDGIIDAPALASADIGIAVGLPDIAMESADITLTRGDPCSVPSAISLSRKVMRKINQNLFWMLIYNIFGVAFAASGLLHPVIAGAAAFCPLLAVMNSLGLKKLSFEPEPPDKQ